MTFKSRWSCSEGYIQTAHSIIVRFRKKLSQKRKLLAFLDKNVNYEFELVYNDWYQRKKHLKEIYKLTT